MRIIFQQTCNAHVQTFAGTLINMYNASTLCKNYKNIINRTRIEQFEPTYVYISISRSCVIMYDCNKIDLKDLKDL